MKKKGVAKRLMLLAASAAVLLTPAAVQASGFFGDLIGAEEYISSGRVISDGQSLYYWKYTLDSYEKEGMLGSFAPNPGTVNQLIRRTGDQEEVILEDTAMGSVWYGGGKIFYERMKPAEYGFTRVVCSLDPESRAVQEICEGEIEGISTDRSHIFAYYIGKLVSVSTETGAEDAVLAEDYASFAAVHDNRVYFSVTGEQDADGMTPITLISTLPDGTDRIELFTGMDGESLGAIVIGEIRFMTVSGENYVYFSFGEIGGTGGMYQGGKLARVKTDGTGAEVLAGGEGPVIIWDGSGELVNADFTVNEDGSVNSLSFMDETARFSEIGYSGFNWFYEKDGDIWMVSAKDGNGHLMFEKEDFAFYGSIPGGEGQFTGVVSMDVIGNLAFAELRTGIENGQDMGWRTGYDLVDGILLQKDLGTGETSVLFRYTGESTDTAAPSGEADVPEDGSGGQDPDASGDEEIAFDPFGDWEG